MNIKRYVVTGLVFFSTAARAEGIEWNGFGDFYYAQTLNEQILPNGFSDDKANFSSFSRFGLNLGGSVSDAWKVAAQIVAKGEDNFSEWTLAATWAYVIYNPSDRFILKIGRQIYPNLIASEFQNVGYLLPYMRIPHILYGLSPVNGFDGALGEYRIDVGSSKLSLGLFTGRPTLGIPAAALAVYTLEAYNLIGATITLDGDGYRIRGQISASRVEAGTAPAAAALWGGTFGPWKGTPLTTTAGYRYDKHNFVSWGELTYSKSVDAEATSTGEKLLESALGGYVLVGYRIGAWLPRYTFTTAQSTSGFPDITQGATAKTKGRASAHNIGVNYALDSQAVLKAEYELHTGSADQRILDVNRGATGPTKAHSIFLGLDFIF